MTSCEICKEKIGTTFLGKPNGTIIKTGNGETSKKHYICPVCQKKYGDKLREKL